MLAKCGFAPETMTLGQRLKATREARGFLKREVYQRTNVSTSALAKVERDEKDFYLESLIPLADLYGVTLEYLFGKKESGSKLPLDGPLSTLVKGNLLTLGERLAFARTVKGVKHIDVARILGVKNGTVSAYECLGVQPIPMRLVQMAELYHVSAAWLLGRSETGAPDLPNDLAGRLLYARALNCLSTTDVEAEVGISNHSVRNYESGKTEPNVQVLGKLAALYRLPFEFFPPLTRSTALDLKTIGGRLQHARNCMGWSQLDVQESTGITRSIISHYEHGKTPHQKHLDKLCSAYGVEKKWVLLGSLDERAHPVPTKEVHG